MNEQPQKTRLLKAEEIAVMLGLKVQTVYTMARRGDFEKVKLSRKCLRFRADAVERFIEAKGRAIAMQRSGPLQGYPSVTSVTPLYLPAFRPVLRSVTLFACDRSKIPSKSLFLNGCYRCDRSNWSSSDVLAETKSEP